MMLPVIARRPKVYKERLADGTSIYVVRKDKLLHPTGPRVHQLFDPLLFLLQFGKLSKAERFTLFSLVRRLRWFGDLTYPDLKEDGILHFVPNSGNNRVIAEIERHVIWTSPFIDEDLREDVPGDSKDIRIIFSGLMHNCESAQIEALVDQFRGFKPPDRADISRAIGSLLKLGVLRRTPKEGRKKRAEFNPPFGAATRSGIVEGILEAEKLGEDGLLKFSANIAEAEPVSKTTYATGRRKRPTLADWKKRALTAEAELKRRDSLKELDIPIRRTAIDEEGKA